MTIKNWCFTILGALAVASCGASNSDNTPSNSESDIASNAESENNSIEDHVRSTNLILFRACPSDPNWGSPTPDDYAAFIIRYYESRNNPNNEMPPIYHLAQELRERIAQILAFPRMEYTEGMTLSDAQDYRQSVIDHSYNCSRFYRLEPVITDRGRSLQR